MNLVDTTSIHVLSSMLDLCSRYRYSKLHGIWRWSGHHDPQSCRFYILLDDTPSFLFNPLTTLFNPKLYWLGVYVHTQTSFTTRGSLEQPPWSRSYKVARPTCLGKNMTLFLKRAWVHYLFQFAPIFSFHSFISSIWLRLRSHEGRFRI